MPTSIPQTFPREAIAAARMCQRQFNIPTSVQLAQWALESSWGTRHAGEGNNYFGMKGASKWGFISKPTWEQKPTGEVIQITAQFRRYPNMLESFIDHAQLLAVRGARYFPARDVWRVKVKEDYVEAARDYAEGIRAAGYATDLRYTEKLIIIMDAHNLYEYDVEADNETDNLLVQGTHPQEGV